jgi:hypothetical protein
MNQHFPAEAWTPSPAFMAFLDGLPKTPSFAKRLRQIEREQDELLEEIRASSKQWKINERERFAALRNDPMRPAPLRGWSNARKVKHVVKGRLHLIEDDDEKGRTGYVERNRFEFDNGDDDGRASTEVQRTTVE